MAEHELNKIVDDDGEVFNLRDSTKQPVADRVTSWSSTPSDTKYPSEKLVKDSLDGKANSADAELSTTSTNPLQNKEITRWHNIIIGDDGFVSGSAANPQLSLQKLKLGALSLYNKGVNIKIYTYDEGDEENASLVFDIANASDSVKDNFYNGFSMDTLFQSEAGKYVKIVYTGSTSCYFRALGVFMDTKDTSSTLSLFYGHLRVGNVDYPESGQFSTWGSLVVAAYSKTSATVAELILRPKTSASKCRIFGFRCLNTYTGSDWAVLIGRATSALKLTNSRKLCVDLSRTADSTFDGSADQTNIPVKNTLPVARGGTGKTSVTAGNYLVGNGTSALQEHTPSAAANNMLSALPDWSANPTDGVKLIRRDTRGSASFGQVTFLTVWNYIKDKISSVLGLTATSYGGNAATATKATQDSDGNAINATYFKSSGNTTLVAGAATKIGTQNGADVKLTLPAHQDISGKMNTSASNATAPSGSGGDGATATLLNNLTYGNSDIVTTDDGDNVLIATTDNGGSVTNKWYKRKLVNLIPWIIKKLGTRLVYDCGAGSTSGDDFDAALAAFNAGQWVIIHSSSGVYYCVGTYSGGLRFKKLSNEASLLKVDTITWNRGSAPTAGNQIEASLSGHTHGNITSDGKLQTDAESIGSGDSLVVTDYSNSGKIARTSVTFDGTTTSKALTPKGTWETFVQDVSGKMNTNAGNAASGALQNLTGQLSEGTSPFTDNTEMFTSYAGNSGFAESGHVNQPYRRKASSMLNYIESKRFYERNPADNSVGTDTKRIQLGYGAYGSGFVGYCCYIVHIFFNLVGGSLQGKGVTLLVNYDWRDTQYQSAKCQILSDNGLIDAGYQIVLANFKSDNNSKVHVCLGLVSTSAPTTLVQFAYSYCKIFRLCSGLNWTHSIASDNVGSYNDLIPSEYVKAISIGNANVGNANQPVYFSNGVPVACNWWVS